VVVGCGPSAAGYKPPSDAAVIAVNNSVSFLERMDYWFTLDPSPENLELMSNPVPGVQYFAAVTVQKEIPDHVYRMTRKGLPRTRPRSRYSANKTPEHWFKRWGCIAKVSDDARYINTGNSAWGALQLAYLLGGKRVLLVGVDGTKELKVDGTKPNNLSHLPLLFKGAVGVIDFAIAGELKVDGIKNMSHEEGNQWLMR